jgi:hypothetical protein
MLHREDRVSSRTREEFSRMTGNGRVDAPTLPFAGGLPTKLRKTERDQLLADLAGCSLGHVYAIRRALRAGTEDSAVAMVLGIVAPSAVETATRSRGARRPGGLRDRRAELLNTII